jgi:hypothetical protein
MHTVGNRGSDRSRQAPRHHPLGPRPRSCRKQERCRRRSGRCGCLQLVQLSSEDLGHADACHHAKGEATSSGSPAGSFSSTPSIRFPAGRRAIRRRSSPSHSPRRGSALTESRSTRGCPSRRFGASAAGTSRATGAPIRVSSPRLSLGSPTGLCAPSQSPATDTGCPSAGL